MKYKNKQGLVPVHKVVTKNGKQYLWTYYVSVDEAKKEGYQHHLPKKEGKDALNKLIRAIRKDIGSDAYRELVAANGVKWEPSDHDGANTMRCSTALYEYLMDGGTLDLETTGKKVSSKLVSEVKDVEEKIKNDGQQKEQPKITIDIPEKKPKPEPVQPEPTPAPNPEPVKPEPVPEPTPEEPVQPTSQQAPKEVGLRRLAQRLGLAYGEKYNEFFLGEGFKTVKNKWGIDEAAPGSIYFDTIRKAPAGKEKYWGNGNYIQLKASFLDKEVIKGELDGKWDMETKRWCIPFKKFIEAMKTFDNIGMSPVVTSLLKNVLEKTDVEAIDLDKKHIGSDYQKPYEKKPYDKKGKYDKKPYDKKGKYDKPYEKKYSKPKEIDISDFSLPEGMKNISLYDHQKRGVKFLLQNKKAVLGLAVGLGKTPTAITAVKQLLNEKKIGRAMVIAPSSVKYNWKEEIEKFSDMKVCVLDSSNVRGKKAEDTWKNAENADIIIVNYEMLRKPEMREKLHSLAPNCVIADEAHKLKNMKAQQTKGFRDTWKNSHYKFFLSATPFPNGKPEETHTILSHLRPDMIGSWANFGKSFVVWDKTSWGGKAVSLKNLKQLKEKMSDVVFMRNHNSPDVNTSMPKERHTTFSIEMTADQKKMYKAISDDIMSEIKVMESKGINASSPAVIAKLKKLEQVALDPDMLAEDPNTIDMNKLYPKEEWAVQTAVDHLEDATNRGLVMFCDMKLPLAKVRQGLINEGVDPDKIAIVSGEVKPEERTAIQAKFNAGDIKVVLCTSAAEEGVNFQHGAHTLIHLDQPWVPKAVTQREGRVLRTGQPSPYTSFLTPLMTGTVEDKKRSKLSAKIGAIEEILGAGTAGSAANNIKADGNTKVFTMDDIKQIIG